VFKQIILQYQKPEGKERYIYIYYLQLLIPKAYDIVNYEIAGLLAFPNWQRPSRPATYGQWLKMPPT
jgi:hypothetical protein